MRRRTFVASSSLGALALAPAALSAQPTPDLGTLPPIPGTGRSGGSATRKILIAGGGFGTAFIRVMAELTGKARPRLCYLPTASADNPAGSVAWFRNCAPLNVEAFVQESFIASSKQKQGWDEVLLSMDGIVCSGGNTLNQLAIWQAQGIDVIMKQAWDHGIVLGGASAGSLCWFEEGTTDSRPKALSTVKCLGFLKGSHSPHYDREVDRRPTYQKLIGSGEMLPGYSCDNDAGLYFENDTVKRVVSSRADAKVYYVSRVGDHAVETVMEPERIA